MEWIPLFEITGGYDMGYKWFSILRKDYNASVVAYVIMPNHLHAIFHFSAEGFNLNIIIANGKKLMAYEIVNWLGGTENTSLLHRSQSFVTERKKSASALNMIAAAKSNAKIFCMNFF
jgi:REP element-mobilizing transposase RayT